jgi:hypothetical protein
MAKPGKTKQASTRWVHNFNPPEQSSWAVPVNWVLTQALKHLLAEEENMVFACQDGKLFIQAYPPAQDAPELGLAAKKKAGAAIRKKLWADEWPPWP